MTLEKAKVGGYYEGDVEGGGLARIQRAEAEGDMQKGRVDVEGTATR